MRDGFERWLAARMMRVRVNTVGDSQLAGGAAVVKRRRPGASAAIAAGNVFLGLAGSGVEMFASVSEWIGWEQLCVQLLYPELPAPRVESGRSVVMVKHAGMSLRQLSVNGELGGPAVVAAAREVRRAHQLPCSYFRGAWSHGDLHLDNVIYDAEADRVRLVDFDTRHVASLPAVERHADDLLVMLLEMAALPGEWRDFARTLVEGYGERAVLECLARRLSMPRGFGKVFLHTRTGNIATREIERRLAELRGIVSDWEK